MYTTKSESYCKLWTAGDYDVSVGVGSSVVTNAALWGGDVDSGGGQVMEGQEE